MRLAFLVLLAGSLTAFAQTNRVDPVVSPEVSTNRQVTFRLRAPRASEVSLSGDWLPQGGKEAMIRNADGVWTVTLGPLEPGRAIYWLNVDGMTLPDPVNPLVKLRARTSASMVDVPGTGQELWQPKEVPHGTIEINWSASKTLGDTRAYYVYTPPGYGKRPGLRYPVLYLLHGNNDTAAGWTDAGRAHFILDNLLAEEKAIPMLVVMPWGHALPYDSPQTNNAALFEKYVLEDLIPQVESKYRVAAGRNSRAVVGLSMGGGHALQIGLDHLEKFSAVGAFSFAIPPNFSERFKDLIDHPEVTNQKLKLLWLGCGKQDPAFERNQQLAQMLQDHGINRVFEATEGRHNYAVWRRYLGEVVPLLFQEKPGIEK